MVRPARTKSNQWPAGEVAAAISGRLAFLVVLAAVFLVFGAAVLVAFLVAAVVLLLAAAVLVVALGLVVAVAARTAGWVRRLAAPGVGVVVQLQLPPNLAQALPVAAAS